MFDKTAVEEYRSLTAPAALKERVLFEAPTHKRKKVRIIPLVAALAACLVLFFGAVWLDAYDDIRISGDWTLSSTASVPLPAGVSSRTSAAHFAIFTVSARNDLMIETDDPLYILTDKGELINTFPYETTGTASIYWYITSPIATVTVNGVTYTLTADEHNGTFQIVQD